MDTTGLEEVPASDLPDASTAGLEEVPASDLPDAPKEKPETAGRVAGLTGRAVLKGTGELVDMPGHMLKLADSIGASVRNHVRGLFGLQPDAAPSPDSQSLGSSAADTSADVLGLAKPETAGERVASNAVSSVPTAALMPEGRIAGGLSAALGGGASQAVTEGGGSPTAAALTGLAVGSTPAAAGGLASAARAGIRGSGQQAADEVAARVQQAQEQGINLSAGAATGNRTLQHVEAASSKIWGGGSITHNAEANRAAAANNIEDITDNLAQGGAKTPMTAGDAINAGAGATKAGMRAQEDTAYSAVDQHIPPNTKGSIHNTMAELDRQTATIPGAENTMNSLTSPKIKAIKDNIVEDLKNANQYNLPSGGNSMPYAAIRGLRTKVGNAIDWGFAPSDPTTNGALKKIYGSLTQDLNDSAAAISPAAAKAAGTANKLYAQNSAVREQLDQVIEKAGGPEAVYTAATSGVKGGSTKIGGVMAALNPDQQNLVRATVLDRLGRAGAERPIDADMFLTNWEKMAAASKTALFGAKGTAGSLRNSLDSLTDTLSTLRNANALRNPSGTAAALGHGLGLAAIFEAGGHLLSGNPASAIGVGTAVGANYALSKALTNPRTAAWLARTAKMPVSALPNALNQLSAMGKTDPTAADLATYVAQSGVVPQEKTKK